MQAPVPPGSRYDPCGGLVRLVDANMVRHDKVFPRTWVYTASRNAIREALRAAAKDCIAVSRDYPDVTATYLHAQGFLTVAYNIHLTGGYKALVITPAGALYLLSLEDNHVDS